MPLVNRFHWCGSALSLLPQPIGVGLICGIGYGVGHEVFGADSARLAPRHLKGIRESVALFGFAVEDFKVGGAALKIRGEALCEPQHEPSAEWVVEKDDAWAGRPA